MEFLICVYMQMAPSLSSFRKYGIPYMCIYANGTISLIIQETVSGQYPNIPILFIFDSSVLNYPKTCVSKKI